jgi:hypothetical protein
MSAHRLEIVGTSLDEIRDVLGVDSKLTIGSEVELEHAATLRPTAISKSSGFAETELVVEAVMTVATGTTTALLSAWLKERLSRKGRKVTVRLDGEELEAAPHDGGA